MATVRSRLPTLSSWLETTRTSELHQHNALRDTVVWEPPSSTCQRSSCSTSEQRDSLVRGSCPPLNEGSWRGSMQGPSYFNISLSKKYSALSMSEEPLVRAHDQGISDASPVPPLTDTSGWTSSTGPLASVFPAFNPAEAAPQGHGAMALSASTPPSPSVITPGHLTGTMGPLDRPFPPDNSPLLSSSRTPSSGKSV